MGKTDTLTKTLSMAEKFLQDLKAQYAADLESVIMYGSALRSDFNPRYSNVNLLVVLADTGLESLKKIARTLKRTEFKLIEPVFFTQKYIRGSLDTFPIEFLDMKDNYRLLYGTDVLAGISADTRHLRFQCEQELKAKLIALKSAYLRSWSRPQLEVLLIRAFTSYMHIVRNLLRLQGIQPAYEKDAVIRECKARFALKTATLDTVLNIKTGKLKLSFAQLDSLLTDFVKEIEIITATLDEA